MGTDIQPVSVDLYFLPVTTRVPLKFGPETLTSVICARVGMTVAGKEGQAQGWGETPLSVQWVWPSSIAYQERCDAMLEMCRQLARAWAYFRTKGHPLEVGHDFWRSELPELLKAFNRKQRAGKEPMPWLAALVCCSPFDLAMHDAYGKLLGVPVYETYNARYMNVDLSYFLKPAVGRRVGARHWC